MNNTDNNLLTHEEPIQHHRKLWHAIIAGFGCGIPTMIVIFSLFCTVAVFAVFYLFGINEALLTRYQQMPPDDILHGLTVILIILLSVSLVFAIIAAILVGRTAYRHSATPRATSRLFTSIFAGIGFTLIFSVIMFVVGFIGGVILMIFLGGTDSFFNILILIVPFGSIVVAIPGGLLVSILVFRKLLQKEEAIANANVQGLSS